MFDKMKTLWDMQKKMQEMKKELDNTDFQIKSSDGLISVVMNGSQEIKEMSISANMAELDKSAFERSVKDVLNRAIQRSHDIAAEKMKSITGLNLPGLT